MEKSIAIFVMINLAIMGLSHFFQYKAWQDFFLLLKSWGNPGAFANGFLTLFMGTLIVSFHNCWSGVPILITLLGWAYVTKSFLIFVYPEWNLRSMGLVAEKAKFKFQVAGVMLFAFAIVIGASIFSGAYS